MLKNVVLIGLTCLVIVATLTTTAFADGTLADVAYREFLDNVTEHPQGSDCVKYNEWFYNGRVSNPYDHGAYTPMYGWNATFVSWCADQLGYITFSVMPRTNNVYEMKTWLTEHGGIITPAHSAESDGEPLLVQPGDLVFAASPAGDMQVGVVINSDAKNATFLVGDVDNGIQMFRKAFQELSEETQFVRLPPVETDDFSKITLFLEKELKLSHAAICGILANIMDESSGLYYYTGDDGYSFGICQWYYERYADLVRFCDMNGYNWESLEGQLQFMKYEFEGPYRSLIDMIQTSADSADGAYEAAYLFCVGYEQPKEKTDLAEKRGLMAEEYYQQLYSPNR